MTHFLDSGWIRGGRQQAKSPPDGKVADALSLPPADTTKVSESIARFQSNLSAIILYLGFTSLWQVDGRSNQRTCVGSIFSAESNKNTSFHDLLLAALDSPTIQSLHGLAHQYFQAVSSLRLGAFFAASHIRSEEICRPSRLIGSGKLEEASELFKMFNTVQVGAENSQPPPELLGALMNAVRCSVSAVLENPTLQIRGGLPRAAPSGFLDSTKRNLLFSDPEVRSLFNLLHLIIEVGFASARSGGVLSVAPSASGQELDLRAAEAGNQSSIGPAIYVGLAGCMATGLQHLFQVAFLSELSSQGQVPAEVATTLLKMAEKFNLGQIRDRVKRFIDMDGGPNAGQLVDLIADRTRGALATLQRGLSFVATRDAFADAVGRMARECSSLRQENGKAAPCLWEDNQFVQVRFQSASGNSCVTLSALPQGRFGLDDPVEGWKFIHVFLNDQVPQSHHFACPPAGVPRGYSEQCLGVLPSASSFVLPAGIIDKLYNRPEFTAELLTVKESLDAMLGKLYERFPWFRSAHGHLPRGVFVTTQAEMIVLEFRLYKQECLGQLRTLAERARDEWRIPDSENFLLTMLESLPQNINLDGELRAEECFVAYTPICKTDGTEIEYETARDVVDGDVASSLSPAQRGAIKEQLAQYVRNDTHLRQLLVALRVDVRLFDSSGQVAFAGKKVDLPKDLHKMLKDQINELAVNIIEGLGLSYTQIWECIKNEGTFHASLLKQLLQEKNFRTDELINWLGREYRVNYDVEQGKGSHSCLKLDGKTYTLSLKAFPLHGSPASICVFNAIEALGLLCPVLRTLIEQER